MCSFLFTKKKKVTTHIFITNFSFIYYNDKNITSLLLGEKIELYYVMNTECRIAMAKKQLLMKNFALLEVKTCILNIINMP